MTINRVLLTAALFAPFLALAAPVASGTLGVPAVSFFAKDTDGVDHAAVEPGAKATVWLFVAHDCPICNGYAAEITRIQSRYEPRGVSFRLVYAETGFSAGEATKHAAEHGFKSPLLLDDSLSLAKACGAVATPEVVVFDAVGNAAYRGRIDDRFWAPGRERPQVTRADLRVALDEILSGRPVSAPRTAAVGCYLTQP